MTMGLFESLARRVSLKAIKTKSFVSHKTRRLNSFNKSLLVLNSILLLLLLTILALGPTDAPCLIVANSRSGSNDNKSLYIKSGAQVPRSVWDFANDVDALSRVLGLADTAEMYDLFEDAEDYLTAKNVKVWPHTKADYKLRWNRLQAHVQYYAENLHKRYVPRLKKRLSPKEFIQTFMMTSTPVIIPSAMMSHLNYSVPNYASLDALAKQFPNPPATTSFPGYIWSGLQKTMLNLNPAVKYLKENELDRNGKPDDLEPCYKAGNSKFCHYPRNTRLDVDNLRSLGIHSPPPFLLPRSFQNPSIWMAPPKHFTSNHHDASDNFILHLMGTKRWTLFPPTDAKFMYKQCVHKGLCKARIRTPDQPTSKEAKHIVNKLANPIIVDIGPGDVLYLPNGWFHHVTSVEGTTTLIANFWTKLDYRANGGLQRAQKNQTWDEIYNGIYTIAEGSKHNVIRH